MALRDLQGKRNHSSLPLQILIYFGEWYTWLWLWNNIALMIWKGKRYFYTSSALGWEILMVILLLILDLSRLRLASRGNLTEEFIPSAWSCSLAPPVLVGYIFFLRLQSYVLRIDVIVNSVAIAFTSLQFLIGLTNVFSIYQEYVAL